MSQGVVIFAFDNQKVCYTDLAAWIAGRINKYLDLPVSLITDQQHNDPNFDQIIVVETPDVNGHHLGAPWRNLQRHRAYELSPYDQTLLLDADYVVCSDHLKTLFDSNQDLLSMRWAYDVTGRRDYADLNYFGANNMPSAWATVIYWRRSTAAALVFDMMAMIQKNWQHYKNIYGITERKYRNDYALAIASNTVMGHIGRWPEIPWSMATVEEDCDLVALDRDTFEIVFKNQSQKVRRLLLKGQDFHAMGKQKLGKLISD
jgi:hypothetical protein